MISQKMQDALNGQIVAEIWSANLYLSMSFFFEGEGFTGFANWMKKQSQEEMSHAYMIADFVIKRGGKVWTDIFPHKPVTKKPAETRMGSGKGSPEYWVAVVKPGRVMFEMSGISEDLAREALRLASHKLPVKCKIVVKAEEQTDESK